MPRPLPCSCSAGGIGKVGAGESGRAHGREARSRRELDPRFLDGVYKMPIGRVSTSPRDERRRHGARRAPIQSPRAASPPTDGFARAGPQPMESIPHTRTGLPACTDQERRTAEWRCAICGGESRHLFSKHGFGIRGCRSCAHQFAEIEPDASHAARVYGDDYFFGRTAGYNDYLSEARLLREHGNRYARLLASHRAPGRVLDVGAAAGFVLEGLLDDGWTGAAVEPNERMARM